MYQLKINTNGVMSQLLIGESYRNMPAYLPENKQAIIVTDSHIRQYYHDVTDKYPVIEIGCGEQHKTIRTLERIYEALLGYNADRNSFVVAMGGGIVCDVAGFAASTYMRGIPFGFVSTTLLSQVDASIGGKNGINFGGYKNMIGTFSQPLFVICDTAMLATLPCAEFVSGLAEIVKVAAIRDAELFSYLERHVGEILNRDSDVLSHIIIESVKIKARVVEHDEREQGERRILNFGHTFGHAVEMLDGISHGAAVSVGMMIAARWSAEDCGLPAGSVEQIERLLERLGLPVATTLSAGDILQTALKDKKRENDVIRLVLLDNIGNAVVRPISVNEINDRLSRYL
ncbi:MAG: 3-dehydroquinate synthase [Bacteroidales bacterium]|nr:3-dehydroquinate synthase [Bacteroidales bacterium]